MALKQSSEQPLHPPVSLYPGQHLHGFEVQAVTPINELRAVAHVARTLNVFEQTTDYVKQTEWTQTNIDKAIIGTATDYLQTIRPSQAATDALTHYLTGQTSEILEERYAQLRRATPKEVKRALLQVLEGNHDKASICVAASREKLETENQKMDQPLSIENIL